MTCITALESSDTQSLVYNISKLKERRRSFVGLILNLLSLSQWSEVREGLI